MKASSKGSSFKKTSRAEMSARPRNSSKDKVTWVVVLAVEPGLDLLHTIEDRTQIAVSGKHNEGRLDPGTTDRAGIADDTLGEALEGLTVQIRGSPQSQAQHEGDDASDQQGIPFRWVHWWSYRRS
jgi:hypothetical protein